MTKDEVLRKLEKLEAEERQAEAEERQAEKDLQALVKMRAEKSSSFQKQSKQIAKTGNLEQFKGLNREQRDRLEEIANIIPKSRFDDPLDSSTKKMYEVANRFLEEEKVPAELVEAKNGVFLKDKTTGTLYVLGDKGKNVRGLLDFLPVAGAVLGAGGLAAATGGLAIAPLALATTIGSGAGAVTAQAVRESYEGDSFGKAVLDSAGAGAVDIGQGAGIGVALGIGLKIAKPIAKSVAALPVAGALAGGAYGALDDTEGNVLDTAATGALAGTGALIAGQTPLGKEAISSAVELNSRLMTKGMAKLDQVTQPLSKPIVEALENSRGGVLGDFGSQFTTWANNVAKNPFGRFVLSLGDEFKEVVEEGSKKGESLLETITKLEKKISSNGKLKTEYEEALVKELGDIKTLQSNILDTVGGADFDKVAKNVKFKFDKVTQEYQRALFDTYKKDAEALTNSLNIRNPEAYANVEDYANKVNQAFDARMTEIQTEASKVNKQFADQIEDARLTLTEKKGKDLVDLESRYTKQIDELEAQKKTLLTNNKFSKEVSTIDSKIQDLNKKIEADQARKIAKLDNQEIAEESKKLLAEDAERKAKESLELAQDSFKNAKADVDIGQDIQDRFLAKYQEDLKLEKDLYDKSTAMAEVEKGRYDASEIFKDINLSDEIGINPENYGNATAQDLLNLKRKIDIEMKGVDKNQFAKLAQLRGRLVSDPDNIFSRSGSEALGTYQKASASRIARNDNFQRREFINALGNIDYKTGKIVRNTQRSQKVFDEMEKLIADDPNVAQRTLEYGYGDSYVDLIQDMKSAKVKNVFRESGDDTSKALSKLKNMTDEGSRSENQFYKDAFNYSDEIKILENAENIKNINTKEGVTDIRFASQKELADIDDTYRKQLLQSKEQTLTEQAKLKEAFETEKAGIEEGITSQKRAVEKQKSLDKLGIESEAKRADLKATRQAEEAKANLLEPLTKEQEELQATKGQLALDKFEKAFQEKMPVEYRTFTRFGGQGPTPIADMIPELAEKDPDFLKAAFDRAGLTSQERQDIFNVTFLPNRGVLTDIANPTDVNLTSDKLIKSFMRGDPRKENLILKPFMTSENEKYFSGLQDTIKSLQGKELNAAELGANITNLDKDSQALLKTQERLQEQFAKEQKMKEGAGEAIGGMLGLGTGAVTGTGVMGSAIGLGLGGALGKNVSNNMYMRSILDKVGRGVASGGAAIGKATAGETVPPLLRAGTQGAVSNAIDLKAQRDLSPTEQEILDKALRGRIKLSATKNVDEQGNSIVGRFLNGLR